MKLRHNQTGITLVVSLIMLVVLTLLVVSAIRFGNINLKIAGNVQTEAEASAATQIGLGQMVQQIEAADNISALVAQPQTVISTGGTSFKVDIAKPVCIFSKDVKTTALDPTKSADIPCFEGTDNEKQVTSTGALTVAPSACKDQQWDVSAAVADTSTGAQLSMLQGVAARVSAQVVCP